MSWNLSLSRIHRNIDTIMEVAFRISSAGLLVRVDRAQ